MSTESSEASTKADFSRVRYAQCWEDADVLLAALDIQPGDRCLSIASGGDNALAMLTRHPGKVLAIDLNPAQLYCLELRVAAYRTLEHGELLELIGSHLSDRRLELYQRCRPLLGEDAGRFWDAHSDHIERGIGSVGKFENYFRIFRERVLPLVHPAARVIELLQPRSAEEQRDFYNQVWDTWRWRLLFRLFFSRFAMGRLGRDPRFFDYVQGSVAERILQRTRYALTELSPAENPYLQWILLGRHLNAFPLALRQEHFDTIRNNLDALEWRLASVEGFCRTEPPSSIQRFNLSDVFEYMSEEATGHLLRSLASIGSQGARLAYWNMLAPRSRPESLAGTLQPKKELAEELHQSDKAFFYSRFVVEEVL